MVDGKPQGFYLLRVQVDMDFPVQPTPNTQRGHPWNTFDPVFHLIVDNSSYLDGVQVAGYSHDENRKGGEIELPQTGSFGIFRKARNDAIQPFPDIVGRFIQVRTPRESNPNAASAIGRDRGNLFHSGYRAHGLLNGAGDQLFDFLGAGVFIFGANAQSRVGDIGHQVDGKPGQGNTAHDDDNQRDHNGQHRAPDGKTGDVHDFSSPAGILTRLTSGFPPFLRAPPAGFLSGRIIEDPSSSR
ncbi:hypothetical protein ES703_123099 [subsurface metagenome]